MPRNVLFVCTGNSCRSILAEALGNAMPRRNFRAFSAGWRPEGYVNPFAIAVLDDLLVPHDKLRSKSWHVFARSGAPAMAAVITLCDAAAREVMPMWNGHPVCAHWGMADPFKASGTHAEIKAAYRETVRILEVRLAAFRALDLAVMARSELRSTLVAIGGAPV